MIPPEIQRTAIRENHDSSSAHYLLRLRLHCNPVPPGPERSLPAKARRGCNRVRCHSALQRSQACPSPIALPTCCAHDAGRKGGSAQLELASPSSTSSIPPAPTPPRRRVRPCRPNGATDLKLTPRNAAILRNGVQRYQLEKTRLGIPVIFPGEALHGFMEYGSTSFPQALGLASTWDPALVKRVFTAVGDEAGSRGAGQVFSPGARHRPRPALGPHRRNLRRRSVSWLRAWASRPSKACRAISS